MKEKRSTELASPGELVKALSEGTGIPVATIVWHDRALADAGLRTKGGRGRSASHVTARDAAHLVVAVLASARIRDANQSVRRYSETVPHRPSSSRKAFKEIGVKELAALPARHSFIDALEALIASAAYGSLAEARLAASLRKRGGINPPVPEIEVGAAFPGTAGDIRLSATSTGVVANMHYTLPDPWDRNGKRKPTAAELDAWEAKVKKYRVDVDLEHYSRVSGRTVMKVADAIADRKETAR